MQGIAEQRPQPARPIAPFAAAAGVLWLAAAGLCAAFAPAEVRASALAAAIASGASMAFALAGLAWGIKRGTNGLLAGFSVGFFARAIAVGVGLVASGSQGKAALTYVAAFFGFYALSQAIEIAYVWSSARSKVRMERSTT